MEASFNYWIDPDGKLYNVPSCGHNQFARELLEDSVGLEAIYTTYKGKYPTQILHELGWVKVKQLGDKIKILGNTVCTAHKVRNTLDPEMNEFQYETAIKLCKRLDVSILQALNDYRV